VSTAWPGPFTRPKGLSSEDAAARLEADGPNVITQQRRIPWWRRVAAQLRDPLILVLIAAAALTVATGDLSDAAVILLVIVVNTAVGVRQELRADQAVRALSELAAPMARVVRDGVEQQVPSAAVTIGDLLVLAEGDIVPADGDVIESAALLVDESSLTGESVPVSKQVGDMASAGTVVVSGRGHAVVTAIGAASAMGRIALMLTSRPRLTPLQRRLAQVGRILAIGAVALCAVVFALGIANGQRLELMIITAISLVVAAVPESLPAVTTLSLALGARRMAARNAIVRRLPAVETLGSVTVLATDKTGTLTEGRMAVRKLWTPQGEALVSGSGYGPDGTVIRAGARITAATAPDMAQLLTAAILCNDATLAPPGEDGGAWTAVGDPTEAALLAAGARLGLDRSLLASRMPRVAEVPFDSVRKRMMTAHAQADTTGDGFWIFCKGAPEVLLNGRILRDGSATLAAAVEQADSLARDGMRVMGVAAGNRRRLPDDLGELESPREPDDRLRLLGLVAIADPLRPNAAAAVRACRAAGIAPVLITGDHPATARSIGRELGFIENGGLVVDGRQTDAIGEAALSGDVGGGEPGGGESALNGDARGGEPALNGDARGGEPALNGDARGSGEPRRRAEPSPPAVPGLTRASVFARTTPEQKLRLVEEFQGMGEIVAMTGDGVNDGPALRRADIGVAMGQHGTEVARQAADLVLADDDLATVVAAVEEGRRIYGNVRRFLLYALSGGTAEIVIMLFGPLLGMPVPLLPAQILWINLMTHGLPGVALGAEPAPPNVMRLPPRPATESILGAGLWQRVLRVAVVISAVSLGAGAWAHSTGRSWQSIIYLILGATQLGVALGVRAKALTLTNLFLPFAVVSAFALQVLGLYLQPLRDLLGTEPLPPSDLLIACAVSVAGYAAARLELRRVVDVAPLTAGRHWASRH